MSAPADWERLRALFEAAVALPSQDRAAFLTDSVNGDTGIRREVESLIAAHEAAGGFLREPTRHGFVTTLSANLEPPGLSTGARLGAFEVVERIGAGGMGEVYRARDTRLDRFVAIKVLPSELGVVPRGRERFEREARAISRLSHPRICTVHDVGVADLDGREIHYIVMELLDGEPLATRLARGPLPIHDALSYGIDIADALVAAHAQSVVHRDLKPGNVMITTTGVKLLDFGLAQLRTAGGPQQGSEIAALTSTGLVFGTVPYMSPEQLRGEPVDIRTDVFAFGALLHEMLTGHRPFEAESQAALIAAILEHEPAAVSARQPLASPGLDRIVQKCLAKNPDERWQTARDLKSELVWVRDGRQDVLPPRRATVHRANRWRWRQLVPTLIAVAAVALLIVNTWQDWRAPSAPERLVTRHSLNLPPGVTLDIPINGISFAIAPDGGRVAFVGVRDGRTSLFIHTFADGKTLEVRDTAGAATPMFSPDGQSVAFAFADASIRSVPVSGGPMQLLAENGNNQVTWLPDARIVTGGPNPLRQLGNDPRAACLNPDTKSGCELSQLAEGEEGHHMPVLTPDRSLLFSVIRGGYWSSLDSIAVLPPGAHEKREVLSNATSPRLIGTDAMIFAQGRTLIATRFDSRAVRVIGESRPLFEVQTALYSGAPMYAVARNGTLVYAEPAHGRRLVWVDRQGREQPAETDERMYSHIRLSPDGTRVAANVFDAERDLWVFGLDGSLTQRLSSGPDRDAMPVWSPDGKEIFFTTGERNVMRVPADRSTPPVKVFALERPDRIHPLSITPDGRRLLTHWGPASGRIDLRVIELGARPKPTLTRLIPDATYDHDGRLSRDGRWLVYESAESTGRRAGQIVVRHFPDVETRKWIISRGTGRQPIWSPDGRAIFYRTDDGTVMSVPVTTTPTFSFGEAVRVMTPTLVLRDAGTGPTYDVSPDGKRFLFIKAPELDIRSLNIVLNWDVEVKAALAGKGR